jgi:hypothetical protein
LQKFILKHVSFAVPRPRRSGKGSLEKEYRKGIPARSLSAKPTEDWLPQYDNLSSCFEAECSDNHCHYEEQSDVVIRLSSGSANA